MLIQSLLLAGSDTSEVLQHLTAGAHSHSDSTQKKRGKSYNYKQNFTHAPVVGGLVGAGSGDVDVRGLLGGQLGELGAQAGQVQQGDLCVCDGSFSVVSVL